MKKVIACILILVMVLTMAPLAWAAGDQVPVSKQKAMEIAKEQLQVSSDYKLIRTSFRMDEMGNKMWSFEWSLQMKKEGRGINVEVDAGTGKIRNFYRWSPDNYGPRKYSVEEARKIAEEFLKRTNPDLVGETRLEPLNGFYFPENAKEGFEVPFRFSRIVNGFPYWDNGVNINVSTANGQVTNYYYNWDKDPLPAADNIIPLGKAREIFDGKYGLELGYLRIFSDIRYAEKMRAAKPVSSASIVTTAKTLSVEAPVQAKNDIMPPRPNEEPKPQIIPAYYPQIMPGAGWIDAVTGDFIGPDGKPVTLPDAVYNKPLGVSVPHTPPAAPLDMDQALALAKTVVEVPADYKLSWVNYDENTDPRWQPTWNFNWNTRKPPYGNISVGINAVTGEITSMGSYNGEQWTQEPVVNEDEAKTIAVEYFKKMFPSKVGDVRLETDPNYETYYYEKGMRPAYNFRFIRLASGIPFNDNGIWLTVDGKGRVSNFNSNWENVEFPGLEGIIAKDKANEIFNTWGTLEAGYVRLMKPDGTFEARLVYRYQQTAYESAIDAKTGEVINRYNGTPVKISKSFADVKGHWAQEDISRLAGKAIVNPQAKNFRPNEAITRADITEMLVRALELNPYYANTASFTDVPKDHKAYGYIEGAYKAGIIKGSGGKFSPDKPITREETAIILVKALGEKAAKADKTDFKDNAKISAWAQKDVAAAAASGVFKGDAKGNFNPRSKVTRAEAASMLARLLEQLAKK